MHKLLCLCLSLLLALQSGCYSVKIASSLEKDDREPSHMFDSLSVGQLVRVFAYTENQDALEVREGRIFRIQDDILILREHTAFRIRVHNIHRIEVLDKEFNVVRTLAAVSIPVIVVFISYSIILIIAVSHVTDD